MVYSGTHDNNTSVGWFKSTGKVEKKHLQDYTGQKVTAKNVHKILHRIALDSVSKLAVVPLQDIIGLGEEGIMNTPGTTKNNWSWRVTSEEFPKDRAQELREMNILFGRYQQPKKEQKTAKKVKKK